MKYALFLVIMNMNPADDGVDSWMVLDGNLSKRDCFAAALDMDKHAAAAELFGPAAHITLRCDIDHAPETWK